jgi:DNA-binding transcriptional MocR family regulator
VPCGGWPRTGSSTPGPGGLIFGYATVNEQAIAEGVGILARVIGEL